MEHISKLYHKRSIRLSEIKDIDCSLLDMEIRNFGTPRQIIWHLFHNQLSIPKCANNMCAKNKKWCRSYYGDYCSKQCSASDPVVIAKAKETSTVRYGVAHIMQDHDRKNQIIEKRKKTNIERYGHENPLGNAEVRAKAANTIKKIYGVDNVFKDATIQQAIRKSNQEKYGVDHFSQSAEFNYKVKSTSQEKYGVDHPSQCDNVKAKKAATVQDVYGGFFHQSDMISKKIHDTNMMKYGHEFPMQSDVVYEKYLHTIRNKFGCDNPMENNVIKQTHSEAMSNKTVQNKIQATMIDKWGVTNYQYAHILPEHIKILTSRELFISFCNNKTISEISYELNVNSSTVYNKIIKFQCNNDINIKKDISSFEKSVFEFISQFDLTIYQNRRDIIAPFELDLFIPSMNIAIECNGDYWHSDIYKDKNYHFKKWKYCHDLGIRLISISESEWKNKTAIYKGMLQVALQQVTNKAGGRQTTVCVINSPLAKKFLNDNHLQGFAQGNKHFGAYLNGELVGVMTFGWTRGSIKSRRFELKRWACRNDIIITGMFSKLFKFSQTILGFTEVISFSDNRWFTGGLYSSNNFTNIAVCKPNYQYYYNNILYHKQQFMKSNIIKKFPEMTEAIANGMTESQAVKELGILKIWDCGKTEWKWVA